MKVAFTSPSASCMFEVFAVSVSPTRAVPVMVGAPVAGLFGAGSGAGGVLALKFLLRALSTSALRALIR